MLYFAMMGAIMVKERIIMKNIEIVTFVPRILKKSFLYHTFQHDHLLWKEQNYKDYRGRTERGNKNTLKWGKIFPGKTIFGDWSDDKAYILPY